MRSLIAAILVCSSALAAAAAPVCWGDCDLAHKASSQCANGQCEPAPEAPAAADSPELSDCPCADAEGACPCCGEETCACPADCPCRKGQCQAEPPPAPERSVVTHRRAGHRLEFAAGQPVRNAARAGVRLVKAPAKAVGKVVKFFKQRKPARRALRAVARGVARIAAAPVKAARRARK